ncbi:MAG: hypothetical protein WCT28_01320 [Patescibacteria group bacterium]|jgi:hypothetical protein
MAKKKKPEGIDSRAEKLPNPVERSFLTFSDAVFGRLDGLQNSKEFTDKNFIFLKDVETEIGFFNENQNDLGEEALARFEKLKVVFAAAEAAAIHGKKVESSESEEDPWRAWREVIDGVDTNLAAAANIENTVGERRASFENAADGIAVLREGLNANTERLETEGVEIDGVPELVNLRLECERLEAALAAYETNFNPSIESSEVQEPTEDLMDENARREIGEHFLAAIEALNARIEDIHTMPVGSDDEIAAVQRVIDQFILDVGLYRDDWEKVIHPILDRFGDSRRPDGWADLVNVHKELRTNVNKLDGEWRFFLSQKEEGKRSEVWKQKFPGFELQVAQLKMNILDARLKVGDERKIVMEALLKEAKALEIDWEVNICPFSPEDRTHGRGSDANIYTSVLKNVVADLEGYISKSLEIRSVGMKRVFKDWYRQVACMDFLWNEGSSNDVHAARAERAGFLERITHEVILDADEEFVRLVPEARREEFKSLIGSSAVYRELFTAIPAQDNNVDPLVSGKEENAEAKAAADLASVVNASAPSTSDDSLLPLPPTSDPIDTAAVNVSPSDSLAPEVSAETPPIENLPDLRAEAIKSHAEEVRKILRDDMFWEEERPQSKRGQMIGTLLRWPIGDRRMSVIKGVRPDRAEDFVYATEFTSLDDLKARIAALKEKYRAEEAVSAVPAPVPEPPIVKAPEPGPVLEPEPMPTSESAPVLVPEVALVAAPSPEPIPEPEPAPEPIPEPEPIIAPVLVAPVIPTPELVPIPVRRDELLHAEERVSSWAKNIREKVGGWFGKGIGDYVAMEVTGERSEREGTDEKMSRGEAIVRGTASVFSVVGKVFGFKSLVDVPRYFTQSYCNANERAYLQEQILSAMEHEVRTRVRGADPEVQTRANIEASDRLRRAIETSPKSEEDFPRAQREAMIKQLDAMRGKYQERNRETMAARSREVAEIIEKGIVPRVSGWQASKEVANSALRVLSLSGIGVGIEAVRGVTYGVMSFREKFEAVAKREKNTGVVANIATVFRETWQTTWKKLTATARTSTERVLNIAEALSTIATVVGMTGITVGGLEEALPGLRAAGVAAEGGVGQMATEARLAIQEHIEKMLPALERMAKRGA